MFQAMNTNKRSVTLDLGSDEGRGCSPSWSAGADVVIENFSPRVMDPFGLTADVLLRVNPKLVVARMPAFGLDGPWRERVGFAPTMEQIAGLAWVTGLPEDPPVTPRGACDPLAGVHAAFAVLAALHFAERTGAGQQVELPMIETVLNATAIQPIESEVFGMTLSRHGNRGHGSADPEHLPVCRRRRLDRGHRPRRPAVAGAGRSDGPAVLVRRGPGDASPGGASGPTRSTAGCTDWFAAQPRDATVERLAAAGIPAAPVVSPSLVTENPQLRDRGFFEDAGPPEHGRRPLSHLRRSPRWPASSGGCMRPPPTLGRAQWRGAARPVRADRRRTGAPCGQRSDRDPTQRAPMKVREH